MGSIGAQAVVLVLTFPSCSVVVVRMSTGILSSVRCRAVLQVTRTDAALNDGENERAEAPSPKTPAQCSPQPKDHLTLNPLILCTYT